MWYIVLVLRWVLVLGGFTLIEVAIDRRGSLFVWERSEGRLEREGVAEMLSSSPKKLHRSKNKGCGRMEMEMASDEGDQRPAGRGRGVVAHQHLLVPGHQRTVSTNTGCN